jgi:hypothetical protein
MVVGDDVAVDAITESIFDLHSQNHINSIISEILCIFKNT